MDEVITKTRVACAGWSEREYYIIIRCVKYKGSRVGCGKGGRVVSVLFCVLLLDCFACGCHFKFGYWILWCYLYFVFFVFSWWGYVYCFFVCVLFVIVIFFSCYFASLVVLSTFVSFSGYIICLNG